MKNPRITSWLMWILLHPEGSSLIIGNQFALKLPESCLEFHYTVSHITGDETGASSVHSQPARMDQARALSKITAGFAGWTMHSVAPARQASRTSSPLAEESTSRMGALGLMARRERQTCKTSSNGRDRSTTVSRGGWTRHLWAAWAGESVEAASLPRWRKAPAQSRMDAFLSERIKMDFWFIFNMSSTPIDSG